jgi:hypothetical protein
MLTEKEVDLILMLEIGIEEIKLPLQFYFANCSKAGMQAIPLES